MNDVEDIRPVRLRHIKISDGSEPTAVEVAGVPFVPDPDGLNGSEGFQSGAFERRVSDEGTGSIRLPNAMGEDGRRHLDRLAVIASNEYRLGDEWVEIWEGDIGAGDLIGVLTPTGTDRSRTEIGVQLADPLVVLRQTREGSAGAWAHGPRDILAFYSRIKQYDLADSFDADEAWASSTVEQTSPSGWTYKSASRVGGDGKVTLAPPTSMTDWAWMRFPVSATDPHGAARLEVVLDVPVLTPENLIAVRLLPVGVTPSFSYAAPIQVWLLPNGIYIASSNREITASTPPGRHRLAIEVRERWLWYYLDGRLMAVEPRPLGDYDRCSIDHYRTENTGGATSVIHSVTYRRLVPYLLDDATDAGPMQLAGAPPAEGLDGRWYSDIDRSFERTLEPIAEPVGRRVEPQINFPAANPPAWRHPSVPSGGAWSAQWTGAIYLADPANTELRVTLTGRCRIWIGDTRWDQQLISRWGATPDSAVTTTAPVGALDGEAGWYPIRIEYQTPGGGSAGVVAQTRVGGAAGTWRALGDTANGGAPLSPLGCFVGMLRRVSHFEVISDIARDFAVQYTVEPRSLESGEFPGRLLLRHQLGRVTDRVITDDEATGVQVETRAEGTVDVLTADAAGLADPEQAAQLAAELINFAGVQPGLHLAAHEEHEQLSDIGSEYSLLQRLGSHLSLRSAVFEKVDARPGRRRDLVDSLPLTGQLAELRWDPGDAVRLHLDSVAVHDVEPRQAMGIAREIRPDGVGLPTLRWRQRPRGIREFIRSLQRQALDQQRHYQGQLAIITGSVGTNDTGTLDRYSRVAWDRDESSLVRAELVVRRKSSTAGQQIWVGGSGTSKTGTTGATNTGKVVFRPGRYDITPWAIQVASSEIAAGLLGGGDFVDFTLELTVRI